MKKLIVICLLLFLSFQAIGQIKPWFVKDKIKINDSLKLLFKNHSASGDWVLCLDTVTYKVGIKQVSAGGGDVYFTDTLTKIGTKNDQRLTEMKDIDFGGWTPATGDLLRYVGGMVNKWQPFTPDYLTLTDTVTIGDKTWADRKFALIGSGGGSSNWKDTLSATIVPITNKTIIVSQFKSKNTNYILSDRNYISVTGTYNVVLGDNAGAYLTSGNYNLIAGYNAGFSAGGTSQNIYLGYGTGYNSSGSGSYNVAIGGYALRSGSNSGYNTAIGAFALENNASSYNAALGYYAGGNSSAAQYEIFLGVRDAGSRANDTIRNPFWAYHGSAVTATRIRLNAGIVTLPQVLLLEPLADPPTNALEGMIYTDTDHHIYYYNGSSWKQLDN